ncbi:MAG: bifunctional UDP-N-acetylglucosamine diphosphorylase/glucosamine-1-phosphate N-acetyltransferase GlmU [Deltaproteobacteria bacterium HGW-Deltaproteobacteria-4]|nr:MAG: bifunctional UDP-N-acetylglucosamine diphosphorylase/glucosamine-1-phosphate N-acetyltransferase GlmU [Deltaproteobacteria bacterium HGW-Deltaproteobacteria-4]
MKSLATVILAAGKGTRMKSALSKVLHPLCGEPLIHYPVRLARQLGSTTTVLVVGHGAEAVETALAAENVTFALQAEQLGTGHALLCAQPALADFSGTILLLCGDVPLLRATTITQLLDYHHGQGASVTVLTATLENPHGYGRVVRDGDEVVAIVEEKDATPEIRALQEINTGIYCFAAPFVFTALSQVGCNNAQGEYYLTDVLALARSAGRKVCALAAAEGEEAMGINDRVQLAEADGLLRQRINRQHQRAGVTIVDPFATYIEPGVTIGADTIIHPGVHLRGTTKVAGNCIVEPGAMITDSCIAEGVHIKAGSIVEGSEIGVGCAIGPMAHLRAGTILLGDNKIGNFVETKKARFGKKSQASHLTYIGDAEVGERVNFGCGTITCNYDGVNKYRTTIGDDVFVGSDTQFIAPVTIGSGSLIAAGSTITKDVPPDALALSRTDQRVIEGWAAKKRAKQQKK